jgi:hypothetical protein
MRNARPSNPTEADFPMTMHVMHYHQMRSLPTNRVEEGPSIMSTVMFPA